MCTWKPLEGLEAINLFGLELLEAQMHITVLDSKRKPLIVQVVKALFVVYERHG
jgi:hypothetical protein